MAIKDQRDGPYGHTSLTVGQFARQQRVNSRTIYRQIESEHRTEREGVFRYGKRRQDVRINPYVYLHYRELPTDAVADANVYRLADFLLPLVLPALDALQALAVALLGARQGAAHRIHLADKYPTNGSKPEV